jgi:hypothetical protein
MVEAQYGVLVLRERLKNRSLSALRRPHRRDIVVVAPGIRSDVYIASSCPDYLRLRELYEGAIRHWAQVQRSLEVSEAIGEKALYFTYLKRDATNKRTMAKDRLSAHRDGLTTSAGQSRV